MGLGFFGLDDIQGCLMQPDIVDLQEFYLSRPGHWARVAIARHINELWPDLSRRRLLGVGYAAPFLTEMPKAQQRMALMPAWQGAARWPKKGLNATFMSRDDDLPLPDRSVDRILIVHGLECCRNPAKMLRETWRVLADGGRLIAVVPNRTGLWSLSDSTPFGTGRPYSLGQVTATLRSNLFMPVAQARALYMPPVRSKTLFRLARPAERIIGALLPQISGAIIVEAEKQIYAGSPVAEISRASTGRYLPIPQSVAARERRNISTARRNRN